MKQLTPEQTQYFYDKIHALHDEIHAAGGIPDIIDFACMLQGWNPLRYSPDPEKNETMILTYGQAKYKVCRIA